MTNGRIIRAGDAYVADNATVVGDVTLGEDANIWFGCVLRGDIAPIEVGARTNIQDLTTVHVDPGVPNIIGEEVMIGHRAVIHGAHVKKGALIGMGAILLARSVIEEGAVVAAGSVVTEGVVIPAGMLAMGTPARVVRAVTEQEAAFIHNSTLEYAARARAYARGEFVSDPEHPREMSCAEVLGGYRRIDSGLSLPGLDAWLFNLPADGAEEGGDLVYLSVCGQGDVSKAYLADVSGHGPGVAHIARSLRDLVRLHLADHDARAFLSGLNQQADSFEGGFATMVAVTFDRGTETLSYAYAGHPRLMLRDTTVGEFRYLEPGHCPIPGARTDLAIGMVSGVDYLQTEIPFARGDMAVLFSDGFVEAPMPGGGRAGEADLLEAANQSSADSAEGFRQDLLAHYRDQLGVETYPDDVSLVVLRRA